MATSFGTDDNFSNLMNQLQSISQQGNYTPAMKLPTPRVTATVSPSNGSNALLSTLAQNGGTGSTGSLLGSSGTLSSLINAIRSQESGGNYHAKNSSSGALGAYQIMPSNLPQWSQSALGHQVSIAQFMNSPAIQDAIAAYQLKQYLGKYGAAGAAVAWYGGPGAVSHMYDKTTQANGYPSLYDYWNSVLRKMQ